MTSSLLQEPICRPYTNFVRRSYSLLDYHADLNLVGWASQLEKESKTESMPESVPNTQYSLVKGERIVRTAPSFIGHVGAMPLI
jgi:hypothetical protein